MQDINAHIAKLRTASQLIATRNTATPREVVGWFGAMQAQDYPAAKWAIAARSPGTTNLDIEQLIVQKQLIRTWPMRGTIHFVLPEDIHWMLDLMAERVFQKFKSAQAQLSLTEAHFDQASAVLERSMQDSGPLIRKDMYEILHQAGVDVEGQRLYHTIAYLALKGRIAMAALDGKQPTFVWLDTWLPKDKRRQLNRQNALAQMARYYIRSHGPVTVHDFAWWTGLKVTDARMAFSLLGNEIIQLSGLPEYWMMADSPAVAGVPDSIFLAPSFDESIVALKDRSAVVSKSDFSKVTPYTNGIFSPVVLVNGQFKGIWKRTQKPKGIVVECSLARQLTAAQSVQLAAEAERYATFLGQSLLSFDVIKL